MYWLLWWPFWWVRKALPQAFPSRSTFDVTATPDITGKVILVTGGNTGIGYEVCLALLKKGGAKVYMAARSEEKAAEAIRQLKTATGQTCEYLKLDLADLGSVKGAAAKFLEKEKKLDILICNAGVMVPSMKDLTKQGYDLQYGVNVLGHFYFTKLLMPALLNASTPTRKSRLITVSSIGHTLLPPTSSYPTAFSPEVTVPGKGRSSLGKMGLYAHSKMGNILMARWVDEEYGEKVVGSSCHPGVIGSELYRSTPSLLTLLAKPITYPSSQGAISILHQALSPECEHAGGKYFVPWAREDMDALDQRVRGAEGSEAARRLETWVEERVEVWEAGR